MRRHHRASLTHHLAAVWFADVVGYSTLTGENEREALRLVRIIQSLSREAARRHGGRIVKFIGDAVLAEFPSTDQAVQSAAVLRNAFAERSEAETGHTHAVRVGVHVGDVAGSPDGDLYGDGVNLASRVQQAAEAGQVLVSEDVRRQLKGRSEFRFASVGERDLKGVGRVELYAAEVVALPEPDVAPLGFERMRPRWVSRRRLITATAVALLVLLAVWGTRRWMFAPGEGFASSNAIAVLPFAVRGDPEFSYLREGIVDLLSTKLDGAGELRSVDPRAVLGLAGQRGDEVDQESARDVARRLGAGYYVMGSVVEAGGRLQIEAVLYDPRREEPIAEASVEGETEKLFELVDELTARLLAGRSQTPGSRVTRIAALTTSSLPALKAYLDGERELRAGRFAPAIDAFQRAVDADSTFALAYYRLSIAGEWMVRGDLAQAAAERAARFTDRLSERDRMLLEAFLAWRRGDATDAERRYRAIVQAYPDDVEAWFQLAEVLFHYGPPRGRSIEESRPAWERVLAYEPDHILSLNHVARLAAAGRRPAEVSSIVDRVLRVSPEAERAWELRALRASLEGDEDEWRRLLAELRAASEASLWTVAGSTALFSGDLDHASSVVGIMADPSRPAEARSLAHVQLAYFALTRGRLAEARAELASATGVEPGSRREYQALLEIVPFLDPAPARLVALRDTLIAWQADRVTPSKIPSTYFFVHDGIHPILKTYLLGVLEAQLGNSTAAENRASLLDRTASPFQAADFPQDLAREIRAEAQLSRGREPQALRLLEGARLQAFYPLLFSSPFFSQARQRYLRAKLFESAGREEEALRWYRSFEHYSVYDLPYVAPSHLRRAEIFDRRGDARRAADHYARFVALWRSADPELQPQVARAQRRLTELRGN